MDSEPLPARLAALSGTGKPGPQAGEGGYRTPVRHSTQREGIAMTDEKQSNAAKAAALHDRVHPERSSRVASVTPQPSKMGRLSVTSRQQRQPRRVFVVTPKPSQIRD